jgi:hypothetical protein
MHLAILQVVTKEPIAFILYLEDEGDMFLGNVGNQLQGYMASQTRRP